MDRDLSKESNRRWESLARAWDERMGDNGNDFHLKIIRPATERLLQIGPGDVALDAACGNGLFSRRLAELGAQVIAFDYSPTLIALARSRHGASGVRFQVADATREADILALARPGSVDKAAANMALMDVAHIAPLLRAVFTLLRDGGCLVCSVVHPCFQTPGMRELPGGEAGDKARPGVAIFQYRTPQAHQTRALARRPDQTPILQFHRPLSVLLGECFAAGFVLDALEEPAFPPGEAWSEIPPALIFRLRKPAREALWPEADPQGGL